MIATRTLEGTASPAQTTSEWRRGWPIVLAGTAGMSVSGLVPYSLGLFMEPLAKSFGWTRDFAAIGPIVIAVFGILLTPFVGALIDRFGPRAVALPGLILSSLAFAAFGLTSGSTRTWLLLWSFYAVVFVAAKPLVWSAAVSRAFHRERGLALAVMLCGMAISQTVTPILAEWLIRTQGWRAAFFWLGLGWGFGVLLIVILFFREQPLTSAAGRETAAGQDRQALSLLRGFLDANIAKIAIASFLLATVSAGVVVHKVPILSGFGVDRVTGARLAATAGIAGIVGKLFTGWLMDRFDGHWAGAFGMAVTGLGVALLLPAGHPYPLIVAAMLIFGFGGGAGLQVATYLTSRFARPDSFGRAFGVVSVLSAIGAGLGPWLFGAAYTAFHSYNPVLIASLPACIIGGWLIAILDPLKGE